MNENNDSPGIHRHVPTDLYRARLEHTIRQAIRSETQVGVATRRRLAPFLRNAAMLAVGVVLGVGTQVASAQVQDARQRSELEAAHELDRRMAVMRVQVALEEHARVRQSFESGALSQQSLLAAATELRATQLAVSRIDLDLAEIRLTSVAPRNELWAPLVGKRDFVRERIKLDVAHAQGRLTIAQNSLAEVERQVRVGTALPSTAHAAGVAVARADRDVKLQASRLALRDQFLKDKSTPEELMRGAQAYEASFDLQLAVRLLDDAKTRLEMLSRDAALGTATRLDVKRSELEVLERAAEVQRLQAQLKKLR